VYPNVLANLSGPKWAITVAQLAAWFQCIISTQVNQVIVAVAAFSSAAYISFTPAVRELMRLIMPCFACRSLLRLCTRHWILRCVHKHCSKSLSTRLPRAP